MCQWGVVSDNTFLNERSAPPSSRCSDQPFFNHTIMIWLNLKIAMLRGPEFIGSSPVERATWLSVLAYCADQENGGVIAGAASWKDRQWQQTCGVTAREVACATKLILSQNDDVVVFGYPVEKQREIELRREIGRASIEKRWSKNDRSPNSTPISTGIGFGNTEGEGNRKGIGKEREGKESEETKHEVEPASPSTSDETRELFPPTPKKRTGPKLTDAEWLQELKKDPTFAHVDIDFEHGKLLRWCEIKHQSPTRLRFLHWIGRIQKPMTGSTGALMR